MQYIRRVESAIFFLRRIKDPPTFWNLCVELITNEKQNRLRRQLKIIETPQQVRF